MINFKGPPAPIPAHPVRGMLQRVFRLAGAVSEREDTLQPVEPRPVS